MTSENPAYDAKLQELSSKAVELEKHSAALRELIQPGLDPKAFHDVFHPLMGAAKEIHDIFHELMQTVGYGHNP